MDTWNLESSGILSKNVLPEKTQFKKTNFALSFVLSAVLLEASLEYKL